MQAILEPVTERYHKSQANQHSAQKPSAMQVARPSPSKIVVKQQQMTERIVPVPIPNLTADLKGILILILRLPTIFISFYKLLVISSSNVGASFVSRL